MSKAITNVALSTAKLLYQQRIAEIEMRLKSDELQVFCDRVCLENTKVALAEFERFVFTENNKK